MAVCPNCRALLAVGLVVGDCVHGEVGEHPPHREPEPAIVVPQVVQITTSAMTSGVIGGYGRNATAK